MSQLQFKLEIFEGPLDLMLALIQKHKLNIQDIEISVLLEQFLLYLERMQDADIEVTADFLEMAARLILIKSAALLPKETVEEMKKELEGALIEYAQCKIAAERLRKHYCGDSIFVRRPMPMEVDLSYKRSHLPEELLLSYGTVADRSRKKASYKPRSITPIVAKSYVTVFTGVISVLKRLRKTGGSVTMKELYKNQPRSNEVAVFLAILELSKDGRIIISEDGESIRLATRSDVEVTT